MILDAVLQRFVEQCPVAVMARLTLQRAISADWVDEQVLGSEQRNRNFPRISSGVIP